jgi:hypothetical protein
MAFIKTSDQDGCFRPESVTHFTVHSTAESSFGKRHYITFMRMFSGNSSIAQHHWQGERTLSYDLIGQVLKRAEHSHDSVLSFDTLIEEQIKVAPKFF